MNEELKHKIYILMASTGILFLLDAQSHIMPIPIMFVLAFVSSFGFVYYLRDMLTGPKEQEVLK